MKIVEMLGNSTVHPVEIENPVPKPDEVIIQMAASAICGSELHTYRGNGIQKGNSGHEAAGTVISVGSDVTGVVPGQRVGVSAVVGCGKCPECAQGRYTWCDSFAVYKNMHAEQFAVPARACHVLPDDVPWEEGVLLSGDGLGVPYHTSTKLQSAEIETIVIFGMGPVGLGNTLLQSYLGRRVIAVDVSDYRLELATKLGADLSLKSDETIIERIKEATKGRGADAAIEAAGRPETVQNCFSAVRRGGRVILNGEQDQVTLSPSRDFIRRDITAIGSWFYHFHEYTDMLKLYRDGLPVSKLVTHQFPLDQAAEAYDRFAKGLTGKVLLRPSTSPA